MSLDAVAAGEWQISHNANRYVESECRFECSPLSHHEGRAGFRQDCLDQPARRWGRCAAVIFPAASRGRLLAVARLGRVDDPHGAVLDINSSLRSPQPSSGVAIRTLRPAQSQRLLQIETASALAASFSPSKLSVLMPAITGRPLMAPQLPRARAGRNPSFMAANAVSTPSATAKLPLSGAPSLM